MITLVVTVSRRWQNGAQGTKGRTAGPSWLAAAPTEGTKTVSDSPTFSLQKTQQKSSQKGTDRPRKLSKINMHTWQIALASPATRQDVFLHTQRPLSGKPSPPVHLDCSTDVICQVFQESGTLHSQGGKVLFDLSILLILFAKWVHICVCCLLQNGGQKDLFILSTFRLKV